MEKQNLLGVFMIRQGRGIMKLLLMFILLLHYSANCSTIIYVRNPEEYNGMTRDELFKEIVNNEEMFGELQEQYNFYDRDMLYEQLKTDSGLIVMGTELDYKFIDFINAMESESGAYYRLYREALEAEEYELARQYLSSLSDLRIVERNISLVNDIYLNYLENNYQLTEGEIENLTEIALQIPHVGGDAVYTARILLGLDPDQNRVPYFQLPIVKKLITSVSVYPNPAKDLINFDFSNYIEESNVTIKLYNNMGQMVHHINTTLQPSYQMNVEKFNSGIYYYKIICTKNDIAKGKIMINR